MKNALPEQLKDMDRSALEAAFSQALFKLQESDQKLQKTDQKQQETQEKLNEMQKRAEKTEQQLDDAQKQLDEAYLEIRLLKELYILKSRLPFTPSTEQMELLFDEAEILSQPISEENEEIIQVSAHTKAKKKKHDLTTLPADTPVIDIQHGLDKEPDCERCGSATERTRDRIVLKVGVKPKEYYIEQHHFPETICTLCEADEGEQNITTHWDDKKTDSLIASPSMVTSCAVRKYADGLPLYRQEAIFQREGFNVSRQTISNWLLSYMGLVKPLRKQFEKHVFTSSLINQDETPLKVLHLPEPATSKSTFMFVQVGTSLSEESAHRVVLYTYIRNRRKETLQSFTKGYHGYVMTDGLKGYLGIENHLNCWVHAVRGFKNIVKVNKKAAGALKFIAVINRLFQIEKSSRKKYAQREEFLAERRKQSTAVFAELKDLMDSSYPQYASQSPMGKAIKYLYTYWDTLTAYVNCYEATPENNLAERALKNFVIGRKAWLFSNTEGGAEASAFYYSLIETAKINGINTYDYLLYCLSEASRCRTETDWEALLPWNMDTEKLKQLKAVRSSAVPDPARLEPYVLRGAN